MLFAWSVNLAYGVFSESFINLCRLIFEVFTFIVLFNSVNIYYNCVSLMENIYMIVSKEVL